MKTDDNLRGCKGTMIGMAVGIVLWAIIICIIF